MISLQKTEFDRIRQEFTVTNRDEKEKNKHRYFIYIYKLFTEEYVEKFHADEFSVDSHDPFEGIKFYKNGELIRTLKFGERFKIRDGDRWMSYDEWVKRNSWRWK